VLLFLSFAFRFLILWFSLLFSLSLHYVCCISLLLHGMMVRPCWMLVIPVGRWFGKIPVCSPIFRACAPKLIEGARQLHQFYWLLFFPFFLLSFLAHRIFIHLIPPTIWTKIPGPSNLASLYWEKKNIIYYYEFLQQMKKNRKQKTKKKTVG